MLRGFPESSFTGSLLLHSGIGIMTMIKGKKLVASVGLLPNHRGVLATSRIRKRGKKEH
jgi:hypothetical protein